MQRHGLSQLAPAADGAGIKKDGTLWSPVTIYCAAVRFQTTYETLRQYPNTQLTRLFSPPYPLYDAPNDAHIIPGGICPHPAIFSCVLEFLRTGQWMMAPDEDLYNAVCSAAASLELPSRPPQLFRGLSQECKYEHQVVELPAPIGSKVGGRGLGSQRASSEAEGKSAPFHSLAGAPTAGSSRHISSNPTGSASELLPTDEASTINTCTMLSLLGFKGFSVVSETKGADRLKTEVTLRRKLPCVKGVEMLAEESPLFQRLLNIV